MADGIRCLCETTFLRQISEPLNDRIEGLEAAIVGVEFLDEEPPDTMFLHLQLKSCAGPKDARLVRQESRQCILYRARAVVHGDRHRGHLLPRQARVIRAQIDGAFDRHFDDLLALINLQRAQAGPPDSS
jgi:hypothetical protein